jgi:hypothetical protein
MLELFIPVFGGTADSRVMEGLGRAAYVSCNIHLKQVPEVCGARGVVVVKALRYKPAGRGFDSRWCHWNFSVTSCRSHYGPGVDSASNRNECQVYFLGVKAAGA